MIFIYKFSFILLAEVTAATPAQQKGRSDNKKGKNLRNVKSGWGLRHYCSTLQRYLDKYAVIRRMKEMFDPFLTQEIMLYVFL